MAKRIVRKKRGVKADGRTTDNNRVESTEPGTGTGNIGDSRGSDGSGDGSGDGSSDRAAEFARLFDESVANDNREADHAPESVRQSNEQDNGNGIGDSDRRNRRGRPAGSRNRSNGNTDNTGSGPGGPERISGANPRTVNVGKLFGETFKLNAAQQKEILQGGVETLFSLPSNWYGQHWRLTKTESEDITKCILLCLATLPKADAKKWLALLNKYAPWFGLIGTLGMAIYPRILLQQAMNENEKLKRQYAPANRQQQPNVEPTLQNNGNGNGANVQPNGRDTASGESVNPLSFQAPFADLFQQPN